MGAHYQGKTSSQSTLISLVSFYACNLECILIHEEKRWKGGEFYNFLSVKIIQRFQIICQKISNKLIFVLHMHTSSPWSDSLTKCIVHVLPILCWKSNTYPSLFYSGGCSPGIQGEDPWGVWRSGPPKIPSAVARNGTRWTHLLLVPWAPSSAGQQDKTLLKYLNFHIFISSGPHPDSGYWCFASSQNVTAVVTWCFDSVMSLDKALFQHALSWPAVMVSNLCCWELTFFKLMSHSEGSTFLIWEAQ